MNKKKKMIKKAAGLLACVGILFIVFAIVLFLSKGNLIKFPRTDIAPVGFIIAGIIYLIGAVGMLLITGDKKMLIEENDERSKTIEARSGLISFLVQTILLFTIIFLLIFTGYLNTVSAFCLIFILVISLIVFTAAQIYYNKKL